jgi:hypothetical protein
MTYGVLLDVLWEIFTEKLLHLMLSFINIFIIALIIVADMYKRCKILNITEKIIPVMFVGAWCTMPL